MISLRNITRSYGEKRVLDDVTFDIKPGRMTGFVGANGAGKTTTMRTILGVLAPDSGQVLWNGKPITQDNRAAIGYMPEERGLYPKSAVLDQLIYLARLRGADKKTARERAIYYLEQLGLEDRMNDHLEKLSLGNQQRAQIAASLVHDPEALVLDEPFSGLDPIAVDIVLGVLRDIAAKGAPVLVSSHQLDLLETLTEDLVIIAKGKVVANGTADDIRAQHTRSQWTLKLVGDAGWVRDQPGITVLEFGSGWVRFEAADEASQQALLRSALQRDTVVSFAPYLLPLTRIFKETVAA